MVKVISALVVLTRDTSNLIYSYLNGASTSDDYSTTYKQYKMIKIFTNIHHITICGLKCFDIHPRYKLILFG